MRKLFIFPVIILLFIACNSTNDVAEKTVTDYLETEDGIKSDFKINFQKFDVSNITVADSIAILQDVFDKEKNKKIESAQKLMDLAKERVNRHEGRGNDLVAQASLPRARKELETALLNLKEANEWRADYLERYKGLPESEVLAVQADTYFSFQNPHLGNASRQEMGAVFILSPDKKECLRMIRKKSLLSAKL